jgi:YgiT-type zinc finger domain-containing protein
VKETIFICDRCGKSVPEDDVTKVTFSHGRGKFDLRDEEFDFCPACGEVVIMEMKNQRKRP